MTLPEMLSALESRIIRRALRACRGNRSHTAHFLGISRRCLLYKMREYGIR